MWSPAPDTPPVRLSRLRWLPYTLLVLPTLSVLAYGWGVAFGVGCAVLFAFGARWATRARPAPVAEPRVLRRVAFVCALSWFARALPWTYALTRRPHTPQNPRPLSAEPLMGACMFAVAGLIASAPWWVATGRHLARWHAARLGPWPGPLANELRRASLLAAWLGALTAVVSDEPLLPVCLGVVLGALTLARHVEFEHARALAWLGDVATDRVVGWSLCEAGNVDDVAAASASTGVLVNAGDGALRAGAAYRGRASSAPVTTVEANREHARWSIAAPPRPMSRAVRLAHVLGIAACIPIVCVTHGYGFPPSLHGSLPRWPRSPLLEITGVHQRSLIINSAPPEVVWTRLPRHARLRRIRQARVPGIELWQVCKWSCRGGMVAINVDGHLAETPEVMARVRDWPLELQAALRLSLMAQTNPWANAPTTALRCGALVWARVRRDDAGPLGPVTFWFDFATGDWGYPHDEHDQPLSCRLRAGDPVRRP